MNFFVFVIILSSILTIALLIKPKLFEKSFKQIPTRSKVFQYGMTAIISGFVGILLSKGNDGNAHEGKESYSESILIEMTKDDFPNVFKALGAENFKKANERLKDAADAIAESQDCDKLTSVFAIDEIKNNDIEFYATCRNNQHFSVKESALGSEIRSLKHKLDHIHPADVLKQCEQMIKAKLLHPSTFKSNMFNQGYSADEQNGNLEITINFEASNDFGLTQKFKGHCIMTEKGINNDDVIIITR